MPELPEVETIRRDLRRSVVGLTVETVDLRRPDVLLQTNPDDLARAMSGDAIQAVDRVGKNLILRMSGGAAVIVHLGMTGQFYVIAADAKPLAHTHIVLNLSGNVRLVFRDVRRFGHVELLADGALDASRSLRNVGLDARARGLTAKRLMQIMSGRSAVIKSALLNQSLVAGLGNIYVCEALHRARVHPEVRCNELGEKQWRALHRAIVKVLDEAIAAEGTTVSDYVTGSGVPGGFQKRLRVYGREGLCCRRRGCSGTVVRIVQSGRATFFCPSCQLK